MKSIACGVERYPRSLDLRFERCLIPLAEGFVGLCRDVGSSRPERGEQHRIMYTTCQLNSATAEVSAYIDSEDDDTGDQASHDTSQQSRQITG